MTGLRFDITWASEIAGADPAEATRGALSVTLADRVVWGNPAGVVEATPAGFTWTWLDLLEHLARVWPQLLFQPYPLQLALTNPGDFPARARARLERLSGPEADARTEEVWQFTEAHNLAHAIGGAELPDLWLVPEGSIVRVATATMSMTLAWEDSLSQLEHFADEVAHRLAASQHPRALAACAAWASRSAESSAEAAALFTGWDVSELPAPALTAISANAPNPLQAAARAVRGLVNPADLHKLLQAIGEAATPESEALARITASAAGVDLSGPAWAQGHRLAAWLRDRDGWGDQRLDPEVVLTRWAVPLRTRKLASSSIDAVAAWRAGSAPVIVVNSEGHHARSPGGRRASLAHEICHLLVDRSGGLPFAEAIGGVVPLELEARARAFAAELLLPKDIAAQEVVAEGAEKALNRLMRRFGVSAEIVAWQIRNSGVPLRKRDEAFLRGRVSRPDDF